MRGYAAIGLLSPKTEINVGSALRAAQCFGAAMVAIEGLRYRRCGTDTMKAYRHIPVVHGELHRLIPFDCIPVAVDLVEGARSLHGYTHPERAFYVFGPEDSTLGKETLAWCRDRVFIPMHGCANLAMAVNIVLYDRSKKRARDDERVLAAVERLVRP